MFADLTGRFFARRAWCCLVAVGALLAAALGGTWWALAGGAAAAGAVVVADREQPRANGLYLRVDGARRHGQVAWAIYRRVARTRSRVPGLLELAHWDWGGQIASL